MQRRSVSFFFLLMLLCQFHSAGAQQKGFLPFNGGQLCYETHGSGTPLIFVHAGFQDHTMWSEQVKHFRKKYKVIVFDVPGHGQTTGSPERPQAADVILALMNGLNIEKAALVGLSLGGAMATDFAVQHPAKVTHLVLVGSGLSGWDENRKVDTTTTQYITALMVALNNKDTAGAATVFVQNWFAGPARSQATFSNKLWQEGYAMTHQNMTRHKVSGWPRFAQLPAIHRLAALNMPVLIVTGEIDMPEVLLMNRWLKEHIRGARQVVLPGVAHMVNLEQPTQFNKLVDDFLSGKNISNSF